MSAVNIDIIRETICATCLSRDRKLYRVDDSKPFSMFCYDLNLNETDGVCWECRHTVFKMAAFKSRALKAQSLLNNLQGNISSLESLSSLSITTQNLDLNNLVFHPVAEVKKEPTVIEMKEEIRSCDELHNNEVKSDEVDHKGFCEESMVNEVCKKELGVVRKKTNKQISNKRVGKRKKLVIGVPITKSPTKEATKKIKVDHIYTTEELTDEQMLAWRERKKDSEYYTSCAPALRCEACVEPFVDEKALAVHMERHTAAFGEAACPVCRQRCSDEFTMHVHKQTHYRLLTCRYCAHQWDCPNALWAHCSNVHDVERTNWYCDLCDKHYTSARNLSKHASRHRASSCEECGKSVRAENLKRHVERMHGKVKMIPCDVCGKEYRGENGIKAHMRTHDSKIDEDAFCVQCEVQFRHKYQYRAHLKTSRKHVTKKDLRFVCKECGKGFLNKPYLKSHVEAIHSKAMTYVCDTCGEAFKTRVARRKHERRTHEGALPGRDHVCDYCGKAFRAKTTLLMHINRHTGSRPYVCKLCDATFGQSGALYNHLRLKHNHKKQKE